VTPAGRHFTSAPAALLRILARMETSDRLRALFRTQNELNFGRLESDGAVMDHGGAKHI
jgi:hypothetical protein